MTIPCQDQISEYENMRNENIKEKQSMYDSLGLNAAKKGLAVDNLEVTFPGTPQAKRKRIVRKTAAARRIAKAPPQHDQIMTPTHKGRLPF